MVHILHISVQYTIFSFLRRLQHLFREGEGAVGLYERSYKGTEGRVETKEEEKNKNLNRINGGGKW